jgi:hypothetical protein
VAMELVIIIVKVFHNNTTIVLCTKVSTLKWPYYQFIISDSQRETDHLLLFSVLSQSHPGSWTCTACGFALHVVFYLRNSEYRSPLWP